jgi:hypothetical protein
LRFYKTLYSKKLCGLFAVKLLSKHIALRALRFLTVQKNKKNFARFAVKNTQVKPET